MRKFSRNLIKNTLTHPQTRRRQDLLAGDGMHDGEVPLHADDNQDEYRGSVAQGVHKLVHAAQEFAEDPAGKSRRRQTRWN